MNFKNQLDQEEHMVNSILEEFDFETCEKVMRFLGWRWGIQNQCVTMDMLKFSALERMKDAIKICKENKNDFRSPFWVSSGGLKATVWKNNYGHITSVQLEFVLTEWENDGDY